MEIGAGIFTQKPSKQKKYYDKNREKLKAKKKEQNKKN